MDTIERAFKELSRAQAMMAAVLDRRMAACEQHDWARYNELEGDFTRTLLALQRAEIDVRELHSRF